MSDDRDEVLDAFLEGRQAIEDFGLRRHVVLLRRRRWYSGSAGVWAPTGTRGRGYPVDVEEVVSPAPRVRDVSSALVVNSGGRYSEGDMRVSKITPRREPAGAGIEGWRLDQPTTAAGEERHVVLVARSGTPHHVREGTARLLQPAPTSVAEALVAANVLRASLALHWADAEAHAVASVAPAPSPEAVDLASALALVSALRAAYAAHRADLAAHPEADAWPLAAGADPVDAQGLLLALHELLRLYNLHVAPGPVQVFEVVELRTERAFSYEMIIRPTRETP